MFSHSLNTRIPHCKRDDRGKSKAAAPDGGFLQKAAFTKRSEQLPDHNRAKSSQNLPGTRLMVSQSCSQEVLEGRNPHRGQAAAERCAQTDAGQHREGRNSSESTLSLVARRGKRPALPQPHAGNIRLEDQV